jgi:hypothetical protein
MPVLTEEHTPLLHPLPRERALTRTLTRTLPTPETLFHAEKIKQQDKDFSSIFKDALTCYISKNIRRRLHGSASYTTVEVAILVHAK